MKPVKRVFLIVLDSFGIGEMPDAALYQDEGSNTLGSIRSREEFRVPNLQRLGLFCIDGVPGMPGDPAVPAGSFARMTERSRGKDTTVGHWEIAGLISPVGQPVFEKTGFPREFISRFESAIGRRVLCNRAYSGTQVLLDYGPEHMRTGRPIVYTSADSVFQVAAHEDVIPLEELYKICGTAREMLCGELAVGRVIARPFVGEYPHYTRTSNRRDYALEPHGDTILDQLCAGGLDVIAVGKIHDIFSGRGITRWIHTEDNTDGMEKTLSLQQEEFAGLCFVNLVDFDMVYGHRNDAAGYARAATQFDCQLGEFLANMKPQDVLILTADHGCDPGNASISHSREYTPMLIVGDAITPGTNLGTRDSFADIGATVMELLGVEGATAGESFLPLVARRG